MKQEKSQLKIGIVLNYVNMILGNLIPIFYTPVMLRLLGQNEYGLYKLSSGITSYLSIISLGIGSAVTRYLIKSREEEGVASEQRMLGLFMVIFQIIAAAALVVGGGLALNLDIWYGESLDFVEIQRMQVLVFLMTCNMALNFSQSPYLAAVSAHERFLFQQCINILTTCVGPLLNIVMLLLGYASVGMAAASLAIGIVSRGIYTVYVRRSMELRPDYRGMPIHMLRSILGFSFWIFVANVVGQLYNATDTVMLGALPSLGTSAVAVYNVGATFNQIVFSLTIGISSLYAPRVNKMVFNGASDRELTDLSIRVGRLQGYIFSLVVSGFIAFGQPFIAFYAGSGYEAAYWVAVLMMVPNMIPLVQSVCLSVVVAKNQHKFRSVVYLGIAIANVIGTWYLMQVMGVVGAALMTGIALIFGQGIVMNWFYHRKTGLDMLRFWRETFPVFLVPVCLCAAAVVLSCGVDLYRLPVLIGGIMAYTLVYLGLSWRFTMNLYEKNLIIGVVRRVFKHKTVP